MLMLYAVTDPRPASRDLPPGVGGAPVRLITACELAAVVSDAPSDRVWESGRALEQAGLVAALFAERDLIPFRFGCIAAGESEVLTLLVEGAERWTDALGCVAGCVEMGVRITKRGTLPDAPDVPAPTGATGREWLLQRRAHYARRDAAADRLHHLAELIGEQLDPLARTRVPDDDRRLVDARVLDYLVPRAGLEGFRQGFARVSAELGHAACLLLSGPWPPYATAARLSLQREWA